MEVVQADFGNNFCTADRCCHFDTARKNIGQNHGIKCTYYPPGDPFDDTAQVRFLAILPFSFGACYVWFVWKIAQSEEFEIFENLDWKGCGLKGKAAKG